LKSTAYIVIPVHSCRTFDVHTVARAFSLALESAGNSSPINSAMIAITTNNSMSVNADRR
jgi:hypothetical protein